jgi:hypothetical protein
MIKNTLIAICILGFVLCLSQTVRACSCRSVTVERAVAGYDVVFVGKVIKITSVKEASVGWVIKESGTLERLKNPRWKKSVDKVRQVTLEVSEAFKGVTGKTIELFTDVYNGGGTCGVRFRIGESYLVYANKRRPLLSEDEAKLPKESWTKEIRLKAEADKFNQHLPALGTNICMRTQPFRFQWVKEEVEEIRRILKNELPSETEKKQIDNIKRIVN